MAINENNQQYNDQMAQQPRMFHPSQNLEPVDNFTSQNSMNHVQFIDGENHLYNRDSFNPSHMQSSLRFVNDANQARQELSSNLEDPPYDENQDNEEDDEGYSPDSSKRKYTSQKKKTKFKATYQTRFKDNEMDKDHEGKFMLPLRAGGSVWILSLGTGETFESRKNFYKIGHTVIRRNYRNNSVTYELCQVALNPETGKPVFVMRGQGKMAYGSFASGVVVKFSQTTGQISGPEIFGLKSEIVQHLIKNPDKISPWTNSIPKYSIDKNFVNFSEEMCEIRPRPQETIPNFIIPKKTQTKKRHSNNDIENDSNEIDTRNNFQQTRIISQNVSKKLSNNNNNMSQMGQMNQVNSLNINPNMISHPKPNLQSFSQHLRRSLLKDPRSENQHFPNTHYVNQSNNNNNFQNNGFTQNQYLQNSYQQVPYQQYPQNIPYQQYPQVNPYQQYNQSYNQTVNNGNHNSNDLPVSNSQNVEQGTNTPIDTAAEINLNMYNL